MIVYHGSTVEIKSPDLNHAKRFLRSYEMESVA